MERSEVYKLLDQERDYQEHQEDAHGWQKTKTVGEWMVLLHYYIAQADKEWSTNTGTAEALNMIRKIGGIAVHCMEEHGAPPRYISK
jgi:hypothetical protein